MIIVDISVEAFNKVYDLKLDDTVTVAKITEEICEMLTQKEKSIPIQNAESLILCKSDTGSILPSGMTLKACSVVSGDRLMLI
ncbi:MAG: EsaB/YukD family protein [Clostridia bacterium]|nr:EsaB/YukD family protein [Clostridia bacterium]